jgi:hypothetical protein
VHVQMCNVRTHSFKLCLERSSAKTETFNPSYKAAVVNPMDSVEYSMSSSHSSMWCIGGAQYRSEQCSSFVTIAPMQHIVRGL